MKDFKLPIDFVDNFIFKANPEYAIVYLYVYRHKTDCNIPAIGEIASALEINTEKVAEAIEYWTALGHDIFTVKKFPPRCEKSRYSSGEISKFAQNDKDLAVLYEETEKIMEKPLSSNDQQTLFWIYNDLGMSTSMIILLLNYGKTIGKCQMRYIEKMAFDWSEKGIVTYEEADKYIYELDRANSYEGRVKKLFGLERNFISTEKTIISQWCNTLKPTKDELIKAYEICIQRTGKFSAKYMNAILENWKNGKAQPNKITGVSAPATRSTKFSNFNQRKDIDYKKLEMEALRKKLSKSKEGVNNG